MAIGQELLNVPMGDMIRQMAFAIAEAQYKLDENAISVAEMMGGLQTVTDRRGEVTFDDSRVFFGYEYMTLPEAVAYATVDDAFTGALNGEESLKLLEIVKKVAQELGVSDINNLSEQQRRIEIRVPTRVSMLELGFTPTFYQFVDTIIEVKIAIKITREVTTSRTSRDSETEKEGRVRLRRRAVTVGSTVTTSQVDASYSARYGYSAEGASLLRTKLSPVPPPPVLEERVRSLMENEAARRAASLEARRNPPTP
ncbi:hypothetical protein [Roseomonas sp. HF4]|uniref:hypothetical protein n=1 Tax=Roseomonas sp. HF4 TaxID=2562313 RepID=UPI00197D0AF4|nr:hypothetical protein [Roseomonas sp. HF4]